MLPDQFEPLQLLPDQLEPLQLLASQLASLQFEPVQSLFDQFDTLQFDPDQFEPLQLDADQLDASQLMFDQFDPDQLLPLQFEADQFDADQLEPLQLDPVHGISPTGFVGSIASGLVIAMNSPWSVSGPTVVLSWTPSVPRSSSKDPKPVERRWVCGRPSFVVFAALYASIRPAPAEFAAVVAIGRAVPIRRAFTWSGVRARFSVNI